MRELRPESYLQAQWLRLIVEKVLPRAVREPYLVAFDHYRTRPVLYQMKHSAVLVVGAYRVLAVAAFNKYACIAEIVAVCVCFILAASAVPPGLLLVLAAVLTTLSLRDIWAYRKLSAGSKVPVHEYCVESAGDTACAGLFVVLSQGFAKYVAPSLVLPSPVLFRASVICMLVISTIRIVLRPMPVLKGPFEESGMPPKERFLATCRLNILWTVLFCLTVMLGTSDIPGYIPDMLRGILPVFLLAMWLAVQLDGLERRNKIQQLFANIEEQALARWKEWLPQGLQRGDPFYRSYTVLTVFIFAGLFLSLESVVRPWLSGQSSNVDFFVAMTEVIGFMALVLTWKYVKRSNIATAEALHKEIRRLRSRNHAD